MAIIVAEWGNNNIQVRLVLGWLYFTLVFLYKNKDMQAKQSFLQGFKVTQGE